MDAPDESGADVDVSDLLAVTGEDPRDDAIRSLRAIRAEAERKVSGEGRIRDTDTEQVRISYIHAIVAACHAERQLLEDKDLTALAEQIRDLADQRGVDVQL